MQPYIIIKQFTIANWSKTVLIDTYLGTRITITIKWMRIQRVYERKGDCRNESSPKVDATLAKNVLKHFLLLNFPTLLLLCALFLSVVFCVGCGGVCEWLEREGPWVLERESMWLRERGRDFVLRLKERKKLNWRDPLQKNPNRVSLWKAATTVPGMGLCCSYFRTYPDDVLCRHFSANCHSHEVFLNFFKAAKLMLSRTLKNSIKNIFCTTFIYSDHRLGKWPTTSSIGIVVDKVVPGLWVKADCGKRRIVGKADCG